MRLGRMLPKALIGSLLPVLVALDVAAAEILSARFDAPTRRYDHGILGDAVEWGSLILKVDSCPGCGRPKTLTSTLSPDTL